MLFLLRWCPQLCKRAQGKEEIIIQKLSKGQGKGKESAQGKIGQGTTEAKARAYPVQMGMRRKQSIFSTREKEQAKREE